MKAILLTISICLAGIAYAQRPNGLSATGEQDHAHILKVSLLSPFVGTLNVHYEKRLDENSSFQLEAFYFSGQIFNQQSDVRGGGLTANYRFYLTKQFPAGWFVQPFLRYQQYWPLPSVRLRNDINIQVGGAGIVFGYQLVAANRISFDAFAGPVYSRLFVNNQSVGNKYLPVFNGGWLRLGVTLGFLF
ncbi:MAG: DUF3575 domain-containing protein [Bacteroidota bacterium]